MVNYQAACVYKIVSATTHLIYVGSTCFSLSRRLTEHRSAYRRYLAGQRERITSFEIMKYADATIVLLEECPCDNKQELHEHERFYIDRLPNCVNKQLPGRTIAEYREDNRDMLAEKSRAYRADNRAYLYARHAAYYATNRVSLTEKRSERIPCECGVLVRRGDHATHRKTARHRARLAQQA